MRSVHKPHTYAYGTQNIGSYPFIGKTADGSGPTVRGRDMVLVAQLVERWIVVPVVAGSIPV